MSGCVMYESAYCMSSLFMCLLDTDFTYYADMWGQKGSGVRLLLPVLFCSHAHQCLLVAEF